MLLEPATADSMLRDLRNDQFAWTASILDSARQYYSDSVLDEVTSALDAATALNFCDDLAALHLLILAPIDPECATHFTDLDLSPMNAAYAHQLRESRN